jgi:twitching motility protein PilT
MARIHDLFKKLHEQKASDLHLAAGQTPGIRVSGEVVPLAGSKVLAEQELKEILREVVNDEQWTEFLEKNDLDFACELEGFGRYRGNYFQQRTGTGAVFRQIPEKIIPLDQLNLPPVIRKVADIPAGLVLVTGPTGSGKSTTLAAIINHINETYVRHIVTIEDPVEFVHTNKKCVFSHREVGTHTKAFGSGLKAVLHQDADVVLVGELRDLETIEAAVTAASMGVLVFGTLHTSSAAKTIDRIIDAFPVESQPSVRDALADSLVAVVSQILCKRRDTGGRIAVNEVLLRTTAVPAAIRDGNTSMLNSIIGAGKRVGMQLMDDKLMELVEQGIISGNDAYLKSSDKRRFQHLAEGEVSKPSPPAKR